MPLRKPWTCRRRGDCCRIPTSVVMTKEERDVLLTRRPDLCREFLERPDGFVALLAGPCPLLGDDGGCTVYDVRPYQCRRFQCFRGPDEPFDEVVRWERLRTNRDLRRQALLNQRKAQAWADTHGWVPS